MWIVVPIGHDRPVYDRPWLTIGLILVCTGIWGAASFYERRAEAEMVAAAESIEMLHYEYPNARIRFPIEGMPPSIGNAINPLIDTDPNRPHAIGDTEMGEAMLRLVRGMNRHPLLRFGYRPGAPTFSGAIAYMFMHAGIFHLVGNMLFLWVSGGVLECFWRRWAFVLLYLGSGAVGLAAHHFSAPSSMAPLVGASAAVAGLIGAYGVSYPKSKIRLGYLLLIPPKVGSFMVPAWLVIPLWGGSQVAYAFLFRGDGVAYWAHVGGFGFGVLVGIVSRLMGWIAVDDGHQMAPPPEEPYPR